MTKLETSQRVVLKELSVALVRAIAADVMSPRD
jgi:hypothetical protein